MSTPAVKTARQKHIEEIREKNHAALVKRVKHDWNVEKITGKKNHIKLCLDEVDVKKVHISADYCFFVSGGKLSKISRKELVKKWDALDPASQKLAYIAVGVSEASMAGTAKPTGTSTKVTEFVKEQMKSVASYPLREPRLSGDGVTTMHQIFATVRIPQQYIATGLQGEPLKKAQQGKHFVVSFDTGSEVQAIEKDVWDYIAGTNGINYTGPRINALVSGVTGDAPEARTNVIVEIGYFQDAARARQIGPWQRVEAGLSARPYEHNLSGSEIYDEFAFILPQGNGTLIMGTSKPAVVWEYLRTSSKGSNDVALIQQWAASQVAGGASGN